MSTTEIKSVELDSGISIFYRTASPANNPGAPTILLLNGFPTSSHQYRNLIPHYRSITSTITAMYTFAERTITIGALLDALHIRSFAVYIFDYGAPVLLCLALQRPEAITAMVSQNGNAYTKQLVCYSQGHYHYSKIAIAFRKWFPARALSRLYKCTKGLGAAWALIQKYWASGSAENRKIVQDAVFTHDTTKWQYTHGSRAPDAIAPETYTLYWVLLQRPANFDIQLDLFKDYQTNVALYPQFQDYFRKSQVPLLAVWGKNDVFIIPPGAEAFKRDLPTAEVILLDAGHFAAETETAEIAALIFSVSVSTGTGALFSILICLP
ncbi:putative hydrolase [Mycena olivaceomarginata]|nr:putative hydrolase [Mycena olivaceomarginata]